MNLHQHLEIFDVLTVIMIVVGLTLFSGTVLLGLDFQTFNDVASALDVFDVSEQWTVTAEVMKFPFVAMSEFYKEFYIAFEQTAVIPEEHFTVAANIFAGISDYAELMAGGYIHVALDQQESYAGQILGAITINELRISDYELEQADQSAMRSLRFAGEAGSSQLTDQEQLAGLILELEALTQKLKSQLNALSNGVKVENN